MKLSLTVAAAALALSVIAPAPAYAAIQSVDDTVGDLDHGTDIKRVTVKHGAFVRVRVKHVDLRKNPARSAGMSVFIDARPDLPGPEYVLGTGLFDGTDYQLTVTDGFKPVDKIVECKYALTLDYAKDQTRIRFNRGCFKNPDEVRVAVKVGAEAKQGNGTDIDWMTKKHAFTPWVAQG